MRHVNCRILRHTIMRCLRTIVKRQIERKYVQANNEFMVTWLGLTHVSGECIKVSVMEINSPYFNLIEGVKNLKKGATKRKGRGFKGQ